MKKTFQRILLWVGVTVGVLVFFAVGIVVILLNLEEVTMVPEYSNDKLTELPITVSTDKTRYEHAAVISVVVTNESAETVVVDPVPFYLTQVRNYRHELINYQPCMVGEYKWWPGTPREFLPGDSYRFKLWTTAACENRFERDGGFAAGATPLFVYVPILVGEARELQYAVSEGFSVAETPIEELYPAVTQP